MPKKESSKFNYYDRYDLKVKALDEKRSINFYKRRRDRNLILSTIILLATIALNHYAEGRFIEKINQHVTYYDEIGGDVSKIRLSDEDIEALTKKFTNK